MVEWRREKTDSHIERRILTGMIVSDKILRHLALIFKPPYFNSPFTQTIAKWCLDYFHKYEQSPKGHIQDIYEFYRRDGLDPDQSQLIGKFLASISQEHEGQEHFNDQLVIDQAEKYMQEQSVILLRDNLTEFVNAGDFLEAQAEIAEFRQVKAVAISGCEPLIDKTLIRRAFEQDDVLFHLPGAFGQLVGPLERGFFLGVAAPYKRGKSWLLSYIGLQALFAKLNVALFSLEMPTIKMVQRLLCSLSGMPIKPPPRDILLYPIWDCFLNQTGDCIKSERCNRITVRTGKIKTDITEAPAEYLPCTACKGTKDWIPDTWLEARKVDTLTWRRAWDKGNAIYEMLMGSRLKMVSWPPFSAGLKEIKATLQIWEYLDNFIPDVVIIDYADIMAPEPGPTEYRHQIDRIWKELKGLSHSQHCLVVTASQTNKTTLDKPNMGEGDLSEDARKLGHVDAMIGINQTKQEKKDRVSRVVVTGQRYEDFSVLTQARILQQLATGQFCLDSAFIKTREK